MVDHHQAAAFVPVPAEVRFGDGELGIRVGAEPFVVDRNRIAGPADHGTCVVLVLRNGEATHGDAAHLLCDLYVIAAAGEGEMASADRREDYFLATVADFLDRGDRGAAGDVLIRWECYPRAVNARFIEKGLMPGNKRRRLPAMLVVNRQDRQPLHEIGKPGPLPASCLFLRQAILEFPYS